LADPEILDDDRGVKHILLSPAVRRHGVSPGRHIVAVTAETEIGERIVSSERLRMLVIILKSGRTESAGRTASIRPTGDGENALVAALIADELGFFGGQKRGVVGNVLVSHGAHLPQEWRGISR
jgi:hypothetical protein